MSLMYGLYIFLTLVDLSCTIHFTFTEIMIQFHFQQAGLHPTADQIELFAYHLPNATLSKLIVSVLLCMLTPC